MLMLIPSQSLHPCCICKTLYQLVVLVLVFCLACPGQLREDKVAHTGFCELDVDAVDRFVCAPSLSDVDVEEPLVYAVVVSKDKWV